MKYAVSPYPVAWKVELQVADAQFGRPCGLAAAAQGAHPGVELGECEGLDEVVVGTVLEAGHPVGDRIQRGEQEDREGGARFALGGEEGERVSVGQSSVGDQAVVCVDGELEVGLGEIAGEVDGEAGFAQACRDRRAEFGVVFKDQYAHDRGAYLAGGVARLLPVERSPFQEALSSP